MPINVFGHEPFPLKLTGNGVEINRPVWSPVPEWYFQGLEGFLTSSLCDLVGAQESFFRSTGADALANRASASRAAGGCYVNPPSSLVPSLPPLEFSGGQCPVVYRVRYSYDFANNGPFTGSTNLQGPILGSVFNAATGNGSEPDGFGRGGVRYNNPEQIIWLTAGQLSNYLTGFNITSVERVDGQVDNCGSLPTSPPEYPPGVDVPPAPAPGDELMPPGVIEVPVPGGGLTIPIGFAYGSVNIDANGVINFDLGGINVSLNPDFNVSIGDPPPSGQSPSDQEYQDGVRDALDSIQDRLISLETDVGRLQDEFIDPLDGSISGGLCDGSDITLDYSGTGFVGLANQINVLSIVTSALFQQFCQLLGDDEVLELLPLGSFGGLDERRFFDVDLPADARIVYLDATTTTSPFAYASPGNDDQGAVQARFAQVSFLAREGDEHYALPAENQYYSRGTYIVPWQRAKIDKVRVCLYSRSRVTISCLRKV